MASGVAALLCCFFIFPTVLPAAERREAERSEGSRSGAAGKTGGKKNRPPHQGPCWEGKPLLGFPPCPQTARATAVLFVCLFQSFVGLFQ
jgi:hypothetical protein